MEQIEKIITTLNKAAPAPCLGIFMASSMVIFLPDFVVDRLGILEFRNANKGTVGWAFILTGSYLIASFIWKVKDYFGQKIQKYFATKRYQKSLHELTNDEKGYLAEYMEGKNTLCCQVEDGIIGGLNAKEIVYRSSNAFDMLEGVPYNLQTWARRYLAEHPELLDGAVERDSY